MTRGVDCICRGYCRGDGARTRPHISFNMTGSRNCPTCQGSEIGSCSKVDGLRASCQQRSARDRHGHCQEKANEHTLGYCTHSQAVCVYRIVIPASGSYRQICFHGVIPFGSWVKAALLSCPGFTSPWGIIRMPFKPLFLCCHIDLVADMDSGDSYVCDDRLHISFLRERVNVAETRG